MLILAGGKGVSAGKVVGVSLLPGGAGGRGGAHTGGHRSDPQRQGLLGTLLAFPSALRISVLLLQIR